MRDQSRLSQQVASESTARLYRLLVGAPCWYVSAGRTTWPAIQLAIGDRVPRARRLDNDFHPEEYRTHEASRSLFVASDWSLVHRGIVVVTSAHPLASSARAREVESHTIARVEVSREGTLELSFDDDFSLIVKPSTEPEADREASWTLHLVGRDEVDQDEKEEVLELTDAGLVESPSE